MFRSPRRAHPMRRAPTPVFFALVALLAASLAPAQPRAPVPDDESQEPGKKAARELYADRFAKAATDDQKSAIAEDMIEMAGKLASGTADQYVLLRIARDVAAQAGDASAAVRAADGLARHFEVEAVAIKGESLLEAGRRADSAKQQAAVVDVALPLMDQLAKAGEFETAIAICELASRCALKLRRRSQVEELSAVRENLQRRQEALREYEAALAELEKNLVDPAANLAAGKYLCFVRGDWDRGLSMLALGGDAKLQALAVRDIRGASTTDDQVALGDAWWELAETWQGDAQQAMKRRAAAWYREASPQLAGLPRMKVDKRVGQLVEAGAEIPDLARSAAKTVTEKTDRRPGEHGIGAGPTDLAVAPFDAREAKRHQQHWASKLGVPVEIHNTAQMRLVLIPPGEFTMGRDRSGNQSPAHKVRITRPFYLKAREVSVGQFRLFVHRTGYKTEAESSGQGSLHCIGASRFERKPEYTWSNPGHEQTANHPVVAVTWNDAVAFCKWLSQKEGIRYRLPTEAEWEYACRAGTTTRYHFGDDEDELATYANLVDAAFRQEWPETKIGIAASDGYARTARAGRFRPNPFGLYDMHGNVAEYCNDWYGGYYAVSPTDDPPGPESGSMHVARGGAWDCGPHGVTSTVRYHIPRLQPYETVGFRVVREVK